MRQASIGELIEFPLEGTAFAGAMTLGPISSSTSDHACVVGTTLGRLHVFIGSNHAYIAEDLGQLTGVCLGDVKNSGLTSIVAINSGGECYVFDLEPEVSLSYLQQQQQQQLQQQDSKSLSEKREAVSPNTPVSLYSDASSGISASASASTATVMATPTATTDGGNGGGSNGSKDEPKVEDSVEGENGTDHEGSGKYNDTVVTSSGVGVKGDTSDRPLIPTATSTAADSNTANTIVIDPTEATAATAATLAMAIPNGGGGGAVGPATPAHIFPSIMQRVSVNARHLILADIDGDGANEIVIGRTDRRLLSYRLQRTASSESDGGYCYVMQPTGEWDVPGQIGSLSMVWDGQNLVLAIAQPGGIVLMLKHDGTLVESPVGMRLNAAMSDPSHCGMAAEVTGGIFFDQVVETDAKGALAFHAVRSDDEGCSGGGGISSSSSSSSSDGSSDKQHLHRNLLRSYTAVCTQAGQLALSSDQGPVWELSLGHQLFAMGCADITGNGRLELAACAWDGTTFVLDKAGNVLRLSLGTSVCAFAAGTYAFTTGKNEGTLAYLTLDGHLRICRPLLCAPPRTQTLKQRLGPLLAGADSVGLASRLGLAAENVSMIDVVHSLYNLNLAAAAAADADEAGSEPSQDTA